MFTKVFLYSGLKKTSCKLVAKSHIVQYLKNVVLLYTKAQSILQFYTYTGPHVIIKTGCAVLQLEKKQDQILFLSIHCLYVCLKTTFLALFRKLLMTFLKNVS